MNILFIYSLKDVANPVKPVRDLKEIHLGISSISSFLKFHHHSTDLFVATKKTERRSLDESIKRFQPDLICFTAVASEYDFISNIAEYIKDKYPHIYLLVGGTHVSLNTDEAIRDAYDALCIGEGEYPTLELVEQLEKSKKPTGIRNLWIKNGNEIEKNRTRELVDDLDQLPFPDRHIWERWVNSPQKSRQVILLGRGCPFECTYCCNHALKRLALGKYVRLRSCDNVLREVREVLEKYPGTEEIYFEVETIGINQPFVMELCAKLEEFNEEYGRPITYGVNLRVTPETDYRDLFEALKRANFGYVAIGLESGSHRVRREILKRHYSNEDVIRTVRLAKGHELRVYMYIMVGIVGETLDDFKETIDCSRACQPDYISLSIFFPYPGTRLYQVCKEKGLLDHKIDPTNERRRASLDLPEFSKRQIQKQFNWFHYHVYKGYRPQYNPIRFYFRYISYRAYQKMYLVRQRLLDAHRVSFLKAQ
jgi:radical SAM superfamily enzyme YgiQ (UPF0313 family)